MAKGFDRFQKVVVNRLKLLNRLVGISASFSSSLTALDEITGKYLKQSSYTWDDLQVNISNVKLPAVNNPNWRDYTFGISGGVTFPVLGFDVNDYLYFDVQSPHSMVLESVLEHHIHYTTPTDGSNSKFKFQLDVIASGVDGSWAVPTGSPFISEKSIDSDYSNKHKLLNIAEIPGVNTTVSSLYSCKLTRIAASADEYSGEIYIKFTDCHVQKDYPGGSRQIYVK